MKDTPLPCGRGRSGGLHADAPFFGVVVVEAGAEVLAPAEGNAAVGDEEPIGGGGGDGEVFFA